MIIIKLKWLRLKIIEDKNINCTAELRADRGMCNLWKTLYIVIIAIKEGIVPYLWAFNAFLMGLRMRGETNGNLGLKRGRELLLADFSSSYLTKWESRT